jgi:hypothetical protein
MSIREPSSRSNSWQDPVGLAVHSSAVNDPMV